jgi:hypothetical protein
MVLCSGCSGTSNEKVVTSSATNIPTQTQSVKPQTTLPTQAHTSSSISTEGSPDNSGKCPTGKCWVDPYTRKDGTKVSGYCRKC